MRRAARGAAPSAARRWKGIAEERYLALRDRDAEIALYWLGDRDTLALLEARQRTRDKLYRDLEAALR